MDGGAGCGGGSGYEFYWSGQPHRSLSADSEGWFSVEKLPCTILCDEMQKTCAFMVVSLRPVSVCVHFERCRT